MTTAILMEADSPHDHICALEAFRKGLKDVEFVTAFEYIDDPSRFSSLVTFGVPKEATLRGQVLREVVKHKPESTKWVVIEKGFIQRDEYFMVGLNGLNGRADFQNSRIFEDDRRVVDLGEFPFQGVNSHGDGINIVVGQIPWDASVQYDNHIRWIRDCATTVSSMKNKKVFAPHPLAPKGTYTKDILKLFDDVAPMEQLWNEKIHRVITQSSNVGVESVLKGWETAAHSPVSMIYEFVNSHYYTSSDKYGADGFKYLSEDYNVWLNRLSYSQWTMEEMEQGLPQRYLQVTK